MKEGMTPAEKAWENFWEDKIRNPLWPDAPAKISFLAGYAAGRAAGLVETAKEQDRINQVCLDIMRERDEARELGQVIKHWVETDFIVDFQGCKDGSVNCGLEHLMRGIVVMEGGKTAIEALRKAGERAMRGDWDHPKQPKLEGTT